MQGLYDAGLDVGSVSVKLVVMNDQGEVLREEYRRHFGEPFQVLLALFEEVAQEYPLDRCRMIAFTGLGREEAGGNPGGDLR